MKEILYISGWMGAGRESSTFKWIEKHWKNALCVEAGGSTDISRAVREVEEIIKDRNVLIIANSFGAFVSSFFKCETIWINPCLWPSMVLGKIADLSTEEVAMLKQLEESRDSEWREEDRTLFYPVCSDKDEIVGNHHTELLSSNKAVVVPNGKHRLTDEERELWLKGVVEEVLAKD